MVASDRIPWVSHAGYHGYWFSWLYGLVVAIETKLKSQLISTRCQQSMVLVDLG